jgi:hypothetical protein
LKASSARLRALRDALREAASSTAEELSRSGSFPWDLRVSRVALCQLGEFPEQAIFCDEEMMASVLLSHRGKLPGTSAISLEPRHALELAGSRGSEGKPLDVFRETGARVLRGILGWFGGAREARVELGDPSVEERSLVATILGTHAPPDTMVISAEASFVSGERAFPAYLYLLVDGKVFHSRFGCLDAQASHGSLGSDC